MFNVKGKVKDTIWHQKSSKLNNIEKKRLSMWDKLSTTFRYKTSSLLFKVIIKSKLDPAGIFININYFLSFNSDKNNCKLYPSYNIWKRSKAKRVNTHKRINRASKRKEN